MRNFSPDEFVTSAPQKDEPSSAPAEEPLGPGWTLALSIGGLSIATLCVAGSILLFVGVLAPRCEPGSPGGATIGSVVLIAGCR